MAKSASAVVNASNRSWPRCIPGSLEEGGSEPPNPSVSSDASTCISDARCLAIDPCESLAVDPCLRPPRARRAITIAVELMMDDVGLVTRRVKRLAIVRIPVHLPEGDEVCMR